jgi:hypothetical protein
MLGATLRVKSRMADLGRPNIGVSTLLLDTNDWFIEDMSIEYANARRRDSVGVTRCNATPTEFRTTTHPDL